MYASNASACIHARASKPTPIANTVPNSAGPVTTMLPFKRTTSKIADEVCERATEERTQRGHDSCGEASGIASANPSGQSLDYVGDSGLDGGFDASLTGPDLHHMGLLKADDLTDDLTFRRLHVPCMAEA